MRGIILLGHGSRDPQWRKPMDDVAARIAASGTAVACAFLELQEPDVATAAGELLSRGATQLTVVPMFFGMGKHAREDLPALIAALMREHPQLSITQRASVGEDPRLLELLARIASE